MAYSKAILNRRCASSSPCFSPLLNSKQSDKSFHILTNAFSPSIIADTNLVNFVAIHYFKKFVSVYAIISLFEKQHITHEHSQTFSYLRKANKRAKSLFCLCILVALVILIPHSLQITDHWIHKITLNFLPPGEIMNQTY